MLLLVEPGTYRFFLDADDYAALWLDGKPAVGGPGGDLKMGALRLEPGLRSLRVLYHRGDRGRVSLAWQPPGRARELLSAKHLRTPGGRPGLAADYLRFEPDLGMPGAEMRERLKALGVRYVITDGWRRAQVLELKAPLVFRGGGIEVYALR